MAKKINRLDFTTKLKVFDALKLHCNKGEDGFAKYEDGWDDARIAAQFAAPVNSNHVKLLRQSEIGDLRAARASTGNLEERMTLVEEFLTLHDPEWRDPAKRLL